MATATDEATASEGLVLNGINGATGGYLLPGLCVEDLARAARGEKPEEEHRKALAGRHAAGAPSFGLGLEWDPQKLEEAGWAVIFASDANPELIAALQPLLALRKGQAGERYRQYSGAEGYRVGEVPDRAHAWLGRDPRKKAPGPADPRKLPYYLLLVGDPESVPFRFQYELDVNYAVGRLHFDTLDEYARYAASVVAHETKAVAPKAADGSRRALFFGVRNRGDRATQLSADRLVAPLADALAKSADKTWTLETQLAAQATKSALMANLLGPQRPALLFTASHGMGFPNGDLRQMTDQGGLLCQDWPGPMLHRGPIPKDFYLSAEDLPGDANLSGLIAMHFACYGAGTPKLDDYAHHTGRREPIAPRAFLSALTRRELSLPKGGALAAVGHVERAWSYSFAWPGAGDDLTVFEGALEQLMAGGRLGAAMNLFSQKYADVAVSLNGVLEDERFGAERNDPVVAGLWTANNDARSYVIVGDPAVRLHAGEA
jgi:Peptidase family C25